MSKTVKPKEFPKQLFVGRDVDDGTTYLIGFYSINEIEEWRNAEIIAVYQLIEKRKLHVQKSLT